MESKSPRSKLRESLSLHGLRSNFVLASRNTSPELNRFTVRPKTGVKNLYNGPPSVDFLIDHNGSVNASYLCSKYAFPIKSRGLIRWILAQDSYLLPRTGITIRDRTILKSYTLFGDTLVNNFLRGSLGELQNRMIRSETFLKLFGIMLYDQFDSYKPLMELPPTRDNLMYKTTPQIDERIISMIVERNKDFIKNPKNIASLIYQYSEELKRIIINAPKLINSLTVYRGFKQETHLSDLNFTSVDFTSTSLSIDTAIKFAQFNKESLKDVEEKIFGGIYEITLPPGTPCIYLESLTECKGEYEIILPPGIHFSTDSKIYYKKLNTGGTEHVAVIHVSVTLPPLHPVGGHRKTKRHSKK